MSHSPTMSLFSERPEQNQQPYSLPVSIFTHCVVIGLLFFGILSAPRIKTPAIAERYAVRHLDLHSIDYPIPQKSNANDIEAPQQRTVTHQPAPSGMPEEQQQIALTPKMLAPKIRRTLIQPDIPKPIALKEDIPLPKVVVWNGAKPLVKMLVAPVPAKPAISNARPSIMVPTEEQRLSDLGMASSDQAHSQLVLPSTTMPVVVHGPVPTNAAPISTTAGSAQSTPAAVMSLSDIHMANGSVALPTANQSASNNATGALTSGQGKNPSPPGKTGAGKGAGNIGNSSDPFGEGTGGRSVTRIARRKEGQFGSVATGSALEEVYPETTRIWSGKWAYTAYLPVGLSKSWIIQYSNARDGNSEPGNIHHIDAPWPYDIVRPNIASGSIGADALMVHGFVNQAGRFESLSVAFPPQYAQAQFVLNSLAQWQFRPAVQNGQNIKVEVLLIIPEVYE